MSLKPKLHNICHAEVLRSILPIRLDPSEYLRMTIWGVCELPSDDAF